MTARCLIPNCQGAWAAQGEISRLSKVGVAIGNVDHGGGLVLADLDSCSPHFMCGDDLLPSRSGAGRRPKITDAELITLAVAQILCNAIPSGRFLRLAPLAPWTPVPLIPKQPGYNKRLRALARDLPGLGQFGEDLAILL